MENDSADNISPRIVYIILAHKLPEQLIRLVRRLQTATAFFLIHVDKKTDLKIYDRMVEALKGVENVRFLDRHARYYGDFNHVKATLNAIEKLSELGLQYDYLVLLTGQDYPIKSNDHIQRFLKESGGRSFLEYFSLPDEGHWKVDNGGLDRIYYWYLHWRGREFAFLKKNLHLWFLPDWLWNFLSLILPVKRGFPWNLDLYGGSAYW